MPFIKEMPEEKGKGNCEKHGEFEFRYQEAFAGNILVSEHCERCAHEDKLKEQEEENRKAKEDYEQRLVDEKIRCGVSKRNINVKLEDFTVSTEAQEKAKSCAKRWLEKFKDSNSAPSMMITGKVGTGKTMLASCILNELIKNPKDLPINMTTYKRIGNKYMIIKLIDMIRSLKETWSRGSERTESQLIKHYSNLDLLIIDEVGMGFDSDTEKMFIFDIIDGRYQNELPTILISNLNVDGIKQSIGDRAIDRLRDGGGVLIGCDWESFRK